ncbi:MAG: hypothetical protein ABJN69_08000 [Hellea sp.]
MNEIDRRLERRVASASVKHMSNAKWRKLFAVLHAAAPPLREVGIKFVNQDRIFSVAVPGPSFESDDDFGECGGISYALFAHIEFLQISKSDISTANVSNDIQALVELLNTAGLWPIQVYEEGIRIVGYEW